MRNSKPIKPTFFIATGVFLILILISLPGFIKVAKQNLSLVDYLKEVLNSPKSIALPVDMQASQHAQVLSSRFALRSNRPADALEWMTPLANSEDNEAQLSYAEVLYANGRFSEAIDLWEKTQSAVILERAAEDFNLNEQPAERLLVDQALYQLDPEKYTSGLAVTLKNQGLYDDATELLLYSRKIFSQSIYSGNWLRYLADVYVEQGLWQDAEKTYLQAVDEDPLDEKTWRNLGLLYLSTLDQPEQAIDCFKTTIRLSPASTSYHLWLAQAYEDSGKIEEALRTYRDVLILSPEDSVALAAVERLSK